MSNDNRTVWEFDTRDLDCNLANIISVALDTYLRDYWSDMDNSLFNDVVTTKELFEDYASGWDSVWQKAMKKKSKNPKLEISISKLEEKEYNKMMRSFKKVFKHLWN